MSVTMIPTLQDTVLQTKKRIEISCLLEHLHIQLIEKSRSQVQKNHNTMNLTKFKEILLN